MFCIRAMEKKYFHSLKDGILHSTRARLVAAFHLSTQQKYSYHCAHKFQPQDFNIAKLSFLQFSMTIA